MPLIMFRSILLSLLFDLSTSLYTRFEYKFLMSSPIIFIMIIMSLIIIPALLQCLFFLLLYHHKGILNHLNWGFISFSYDFFFRPKSLLSHHLSFVVKNFSLIKQAHFSSYAASFTNIFILNYQ